MNVVNGKNHWIYELRFEKDTDIGMLMRKATPDAPAATDLDLIQGNNTNATFVAVGGLHARRLKCLEAHQNMLRVLYHVPPAFSRSHFQVAKTSKPQLARTADMYGCESVAQIYIENDLHLHRVEVQDRCNAEPLDMLNFAVKLKSDWIFMEAATNLIGRDRAFYDAAQPKLKEPEVAEVMNKKRSEFKETLLAIEHSLFRIQPLTSTPPRSHTAVSLFRQWLSDQLDKGLGSELGQGYEVLYHAITKREYSFRIPQNLRFAQDLFKKILGANTKGTDPQLVALEAETNTVFSAAAVIIQPILVDITRRRDNTGNGNGGLKFMGVGKGELPWLMG